MWQVKKFKTLKAMRQWINKREETIQYEQIFIKNGYAVEYRKLRIIG